MRLTHIGFSLTLILGAASALAGPGEHRRDERGTVELTAGIYPMQNMALDRNRQGGDQPDQRQNDSRRGRYLGLPDTSGYGSQGDSGSNAQDNSSRRQGKMSPEERRALRRQIDEAGHDIY